MKNTIFIFLLLSLALCVACGPDEINKNGNCPPFSLSYDPPFSDPIWHPSGDFIGFNYVPMISKDVSDGKKKCPAFTFDYEEQGFYLIDEDGSNLRKILPYQLTTPAWSPDGNWLAHSFEGQIFIMPFDGEQFLEEEKEQLTFEGNNHYPAWSPNGQMLSFTQSVCGDVICGIWTGHVSTKEISLVSQYGGYGTWHPNRDSILFRRSALDDMGRQFGDSLWVFSLNESERKFFVRIISPNNSNRYFKYSPVGEWIGFISQYDDGSGVFLCLIDEYGLNMNCLKDEQIRAFSWSPNGRIVYLAFDGKPMDETNGSLWIMDGDGTNKHPLILNEFELIE